jgi:hypothetical protein
MLFCMTLVPRPQNLVLFLGIPSLCMVKMAVLPPTIRSSKCPRLEMVPAMLIIMTPEVGRPMYRSSTHCLQSCGWVVLMWFKHAFQLGTSQGGTATTSALGLSAGTLALRASKAVGHFGPICGGAKFFSPPLQGCGSPRTTATQSLPRWGGCGITQEQRFVL